ncbi:putative membrane protein YesL [Caldalkalibacillus uzonensis]|uniref:Membrane protein YesL n=1 Tax=Caldalkalibacillus uzonensis TaxID=353224 RepID=A0ABU0CR62_9BACI|nr:YesL family protein [Caldalkalibacillus uzonensis]MDQ0338622.1 putative membrane protein YesL [Caldalkalibacillus uzonensis]
MELTGFMGVLFRICEWIMRLAYAQLLWLIFTLAGLGVLGFFPATAALFSVTRKWIMKQTEIPIFKHFWQIYKNDFFTANAVGYIMGIIGFALYFYLFLFQSMEGSLSIILTVLTIMLGIIYLMTLLFIMPVFVHYDLKVLQFVKYAFIIAVSSPLHAVLMAAAVAAVYYLLTVFHGLIPFFSMSVLSYLLMWIAMLSFDRLRNKQENKNA